MLVTVRADATVYNWFLVQISVNINQYCCIPFIGRFRLFLAQYRNNIFCISMKSTYTGKEAVGWLAIQHVTGKQVAPDKQTEQTKKPRFVKTWTLGVYDF